MLKQLYIDNHSSLVPLQPLDFFTLNPIKISIEPHEISIKPYDISMKSH